MFIGGVTVEVLGCCMRDQSHSSSSGTSRTLPIELTTNVKSSTIVPRARGSRDGNKHLNAH
jgi:hypothetical protein